MASRATVDSRRMVPIRCFECGMPVAHKQMTFDTMLDGGCTPLQAFEALRVDRACCRNLLFTSAEDTALRQRLDATTLRPPYVANVTYASSLACPPYTLSADGTTPVVETQTPRD